MAGCKKVIDNDRNDLETDTEGCHNDLYASNLIIESVSDALDNTQHADIDSYTLDLIEYK